MFSFYGTLRGYSLFNNYLDQILPNFGPPRVDKNGHFTYYLSFVTWPLRGLSTDPLPPSSFPRSYWMPPLGKNKIETTPITLCQILGHDLFCGKSAMLAINMDFSSPRNYSENDRSFAHIPIRKLAFFSCELAAGLLLSEAVMLRLS